jgi:hypothetical protein
MQGMLTALLRYCVGWGMGRGMGNQSIEWGMTLSRFQGEWEISATPLFFLACYFRETNFFYCDIPATWKTSPWLPHSN